MNHSPITTKLLSDNTWLAKYKTLEFFADTEQQAIALATTYINSKPRRVKR